MKEIWLKINKINNIFNKKQVILGIIFVLSVIVAFNLGFIIGSRMYNEPSIVINCP